MMDGVELGAVENSFSSESDHYPTSANKPSSCAVTITIPESGLVPTQEVDAAGFF